MAAHLLWEPILDVRRNLVREVDNTRAAPPIVYDRVLLRVITLFELDDVRDIRAAPLVDRLIVVANNAELDRPARKQLDEALLGWVNVLILIDHEVPQGKVNIVQDAGGLQGANRLIDLLSVSEKAAQVQLAVVAADNIPEVSLELIDRQQFILYNVDVRPELANGLEQLRVQLLQLDAVRFNRQEG